MNRNVLLKFPCVWLILSAALQAQMIDTSRGDKLLAEYFQIETGKLANACLAEVKTEADWQARREEYRRQLREMLGLDPWPERTPLDPVVTGKIEHELFLVEKLQFQSRPGLYVTGNLYLPKKIEQPLPAILYVCGHGKAKPGNISFGNKTVYQHHGEWFARNGYACLVIDTIQLGEIEGVHHGTYNLNQFWWNARGYTPAGVEAWNGIRALDYLQSRPEVDKEKLGLTGRSGGGAYSWWIAALDERVKAVVPVAGITDLENHVVDGTVEGHCDCMFFVNTYRWDFAQVAALVSPRPLLISNTDKDTIFPLEGVVRVHEKVRRIYQLQNAGKNLGLQITEGPHKDTQELHIHSFRWFNRFLKGDESSQVTIAAEKLIPPDQLRVFAELPQDEIVTRVAETFVPTAAPPVVPESAEAWKARRAVVISTLDQKVFRGWPQAPEDLNIQPAFSVERDGVRLSAWDFTSQHPFRLRLYLAHRAGIKANDCSLVVLNALDQPGWMKWLASMRTQFEGELKGESLPPGDETEFKNLKDLFANQKWAMAWVAPRGIGPTAWNQNPEKQTQHRRRFQLLGQTLDGMRVWDVRRAANALRRADGLDKVPLWLQGEVGMSGIVLYAGLYEPDIVRLDLWSLPASHRDGPDFLNVQRFVDIPEIVALTAENSRVRIYQPTVNGWDFPKAVSMKLGWDAQHLQIRAVPGK